MKKVSKEELEVWKKRIRLDSILTYISLIVSIIVLIIVLAD